MSSIWANFEIAQFCYKGFFLWALLPQHPPQGSQLFRPQRVRCEVGGLLCGWILQVAQDGEVPNRSCGFHLFLDIVRIAQAPHKARCWKHGPAPQHAMQQGAWSNNDPQQLISRMNLKNPCLLLLVPHLGDDALRRYDRQLLFFCSTGNLQKLLHRAKDRVLMSPGGEQAASPECSVVASDVQPNIWGKCPENVLSRGPKGYFCLQQQHAVH
mmetsp:Transcript_25205/g.52310  ORF Transcript_25205/g.52310 Transcript_25205/m.52310 type:complete len:212 (-) Transcript_25205:506-1141(-)